MQRHVICIFIRDWSRNVSVKICETSKFHNFLIFQRDFHQDFHQTCSENFTLSSEIKLDQLRTSPLTVQSEVKWS